jgi:Leucine-rich repeat (LRR) protein
MSQKLTPKLIRKLFPEQNSKEIERLNVSAKDIVEVYFLQMLYIYSTVTLDHRSNPIPSLLKSWRACKRGLLLYKYHINETLRSLAGQVGDLTTCPSLIRIDLSQNAIQDTSFATTCQQIKWLSLANNPVTDLRPLECLTNLQACLLFVHSQLPQCR